MKPLVSIVTPSYNQAKYLRATMESVLKQDYANLEYVVVDGVSNDGSQEIISEYQDQLAWWTSESDQGQADAINKGFREVNGDIVAWLNSDDLYLPWTIAEAVDAMEKFPDAGMVYGDAVSADGSGRLLNELRFNQWDLSDLLQFKIICQPAVFMRRTALEKAGYLNPDYHFFLDHELWIRLARGSQMVHCPRIWAVSRYHDQAKNIRLASQSGDEVWRILGWAEGEKDLSEIISDNKRKVLSGAYQINARYLLDSGKSLQAFQKYYQSMISWPPSIRYYWHRFLFAGLSVLGLGFIGGWYYYLKSKKIPDLGDDPRLRGWPGLQIH